MKILKYKYNPNKAGVFRVSVVPRPAVGEGDLVLMGSQDAPILTYADMLVTDKDGKVLLLQRNPSCDFEPNKWGFAGGKVMPSETTKDGAIRECFEESGITVDPESVVKLAEIVNDDPASVSHYFKGTPTNDLKLGDEHQNYAWVSADELDNYELILDNKDRFRDLIDGTIKMSSEDIKGVFYAPVMIPDLKITRVDDKTGEKYQVYYDAETVEQLCYNYWKQCGNRNTNLDHEAENTEGVYPVECWIVKDPIQDKSKALNMPVQKIGTWIMGYKADSPEVLEKVKNKLLQGLSIEGHLDAEEEVNVKFNKSVMSKKTLLERFDDFKATLMSAIEDDKPKEKTAEELAAEEEAKTAEMEAEKTPEELAAEAAKAAEDKGEPDELETVKAENEELKKKVSDLEAELAKVENDAVLMSAQLEEVETAFESYKAVKMSSQSLADMPKEKKVLTAAEEKHAKFLENVYSQL